MPHTQGNTYTLLSVERAIDELRRQQPLKIIGAAGERITLAAIESLHAPAYAALNNHTSQLLLTAARARSLKLADHAVCIPTAALAWAQLTTLADPTAPAAPLPALHPIAATPQQLQLLTLAKYATILPALLLSPASLPDSYTLELAALSHYITHPNLNISETANASLPLAGAENARLLTFRTANSMSTHLAIIIGKPEATPLTRIHSSCLTGDILGSLRCDCGDQLNLAIEQINAHGSGIILYLHQEGRGIGLTNKLRAYMLQERGLDTYEANLALGFDEDERDFTIAAAMLQKLGHPSIRMLTNNPHKLAALQKAGITITERVPLIAKSGQHNHNYLEAKAKKSGHML